MRPSRHAWIELDLNALHQNIQRVRTALLPDAELIFVVKSNAYGHGMADVAPCARQDGIEWFAVAHMREAVQLRALLPDAQILLTSAMPPAETDIALEQDIIPMIVSLEHGLALAQAAADAGKPLHCHVKIDTGMGRLGLDWERAPAELLSLAAADSLCLDGLCTHFASSDSPDRQFTELQASRFLEVNTRCEAKGLCIPFKHVANSGAVLRDSAWNLDAVRPGILLYGYGSEPSERIPVPADTGPGPIYTQPILQWKTRVVQAKQVPADFPVSYDSSYRTPAPTCIATIDVGYADGFSRRLSNRGAVLIGGRRCPVVGRVTMNLVTVDLGNAAAAEPGAEVVLLGRQGQEAIWATEMAELCDTIPYEILTGIRSKR